MLVTILLFQNYSHKIDDLLFSKLCQHIRLRYINHISLLCHRWSPNNVAIVKKWHHKGWILNTQHSRWQGPKPNNWSKPWSNSRNHITKLICKFQDNVESIKTPRYRTECICTSTNWGSDATPFDAYLKALSMQLDLSTFKHTETW